MATYKKQPPRPRDQAKWVEKLQRFAECIASDPGRYNLREDESAEISRAVEAFAKAQAITACERTKTKCTVDDKNKKRRIAEAIHSKYYNLIKNDPGVSDGDKVSIGVRLVNLERTEIHVPNRPPCLTVTGAIQGQHTLKFVDEGTLPLLKDADAPLGGSGKPHGAVFLQIYAAVGEGKKQKREDAREVGLFTRNPIRIEYQEANNGKQACYWGRWISRKGETGPWSLMTSMAIAA
jgi:hypothetical protein